MDLFFAKPIHGSPLFRMKDKTGRPLMAIPFTLLGTNERKRNGNSGAKCPVLTYQDGAKRPVFTNHNGAKRPALWKNRIPIQWKSPGFAQGRSRLQACFLSRLRKLSLRKVNGFLKTFVTRPTKMAAAIVPSRTPTSCPRKAKERMMERRTRVTSKATFM